MRMKRGKNRPMPATPGSPLGGIIANQCIECSRFYAMGERNPENTARGFLDWTPGQIVYRKGISHGGCSDECGMKEYRRYAHHKVNTRLRAEGYDEEPLPDDLIRPWERAGTPMEYDGPWPPEGWDAHGNRIEPDEARQEPPAE